MNTILAIALGISAFAQPVLSGGQPSGMAAHDATSVSILEGRDAGHDNLVMVDAAEIISINRTSVVLVLEQALVLIDPVGPQSQYSRFGRPDIVVLTKAHPDHLSIETMIGLLRRDTVVIAPQTVIDQFPLMISNNVIAPFDAGAVQVVDGIRFAAVTGGADAPERAQVYGRVRGDIGVVLEVSARQMYF